MLPTKKICGKNSGGESHEVQPDGQPTENSQLKRQIVILDRFVNKPGIGPLILKRRLRAAVRSALSDARSRSNSLFAVKRALQHAKGGIATTPERDLWKRIERRRRELSERADTVQDIDYGAGYAGSQYNEDQQRREW